MKAYSILLTTLLIGLHVSAQSPKVKSDKAAIKSMCGCYGVTFDYAETFPSDSAYKIHDPYHASAGAEWIFVEEETENKIVLQHLLIVGDNHIIKHWRQDWLYENDEFYHFDKDLHWKYSKVPGREVKGQWTQHVYQVDDSPRYTGSATWVEVDGRRFWENTTDAPLPRREFSKRDDYNVMRRTNRHELLGKDWVHEQDNLKIIRGPKKDSVLVAEKGINAYTRIDDVKCEAAVKWWKEHQAFWKLVRAEWDQVFGRGEDLFLVKKSEDKLLWEALFALDEKLAPEAAQKPEATRKEIAATIGRYLSDGSRAENASY